MNISRIFAIFFALSLISTGVSARPDVFFSDSKDFGGVYLTHEFDRTFTYLKFIMSEPVPGVELPAQSYDAAALQDFMANDYQFNNPALKPDFLRMLEESGAYDWEMAPWIAELNTLLAAFARRHPGSVRG